MGRDTYRHTIKTQCFMGINKILYQGRKAASLRRIILLTLAVCLTLAWKPTLGEVTVQEKTQYYSIHGLSNKQLLKEINAKGPYSEKLSRRVHATTFWKITWKISPLIREAKCSIGTAEVHVVVTFTMPNWVNEISGGDTLKKRWRQYYSALQDHENGHKQLAIDGAHEIDRKIMLLKPRPNCDALVKAANALGKRILVEIRQRNDDFDLTTNHDKIRL